MLTLADACQTGLFSRELHSNSKKDWNTFYLSLDSLRFPSRVKVRPKAFNFSITFSISRVSEQGASSYIIPFECDALPGYAG